MLLSRGQRDKLGKYVNLASGITIDLSIAGPSVYDYCCFGVDGAGKLSDDRYMIFYNQTMSPGGEIRYTASGNSARFEVNLSMLPPSVCKLVFTASIDGTGVMSGISRHTFTLSQNGAPALSLEMTGADFRQEKAIISVELYRKDEWRINAVANGFNGGLSALLAAYGGEEITDSAPQAQANYAASTTAGYTPAPAPHTASSPISNPHTCSTPHTTGGPVSNPRTISIPHTTPQPTPVQAPTAPIVTSSGVVLKKTEEQLTKEVMGKIRLSKDKVKLEKHVVSLSKTVVNLSKKSGVDLGSTSAKVVVVLDYSGSMYSLYSDGTVQNTINKLVPLGLTFDDNGSIDVYLFQNNYRKMPDLNLSNYEYYINNIVNASGYEMGGTSYAPVLKAIIEGDVQYKGGFLGFGGHREVTHALVDDGDPTFILFITDGENADKTASDAIIRRSSEMNVFIQFIGIGEERFTYLRQLDDMSGRKRDNTGFSAMRDLNNVSDEKLYNNVLEQFSQWLRGLQ